MNIFGRHLDFDARSLLLFGGIFFLIGISVLAYHPVMPDLFHTHLPVWTRVVIWCGSGILAITGAFVGGKFSIVGFGSLFIGPAQRCLSYAWALITEAYAWAVDAPGVHRVNTAYLAACFLYLLITLCVWHLARGDEDASQPPIIVHATIPEPKP